MNEFIGKGTLAPFDMNSSSELIAKTIFSEIALLDLEIKRSEERTKELQARKFYQSPFSGRTDQIIASQQQNQINKMFADLMQRHIQLSVCSSVALTGAVDQLKSHVLNGFEDANGNTVKLSENGRALAESMSSMIHGFIQTADNTRNSLVSFEDHIVSSNSRFDVIESMISVSNDRHDHADLLLAAHGDFIESLSEKVGAVGKTGEHSTEQLNLLSQRVDKESDSLLSLQGELSARNEELKSLAIRHDGQGQAVAALQGKLRAFIVGSSALFLISWAALAYIVVNS